MKIPAALPRLVTKLMIKKAPGIPQIRVLTATLAAQMRVKERICLGPAQILQSY